MGKAVIWIINLSSGPEAWYLAVQTLTTTQQISWRAVFSVTFQNFTYTHTYMIYIYSVLHSNMIFSHIAWLDFVILDIYISLGSLTSIFNHIYRYKELHLSWWQNVHEKMLRKRSGWKNQLCVHPGDFRPYTVGGHKYVILEIKR